MGTPIEGWDWG